jgi:Tfp pilus assembly protein FimT
MTTALTQKNLMRQEGGMTMAELVIVLAITGALAVFLGTELQAMADQVYLNTAVAEVVGDLRYARSLAVREGQTIQVALDPDQPGVTLYRSNDATQPLAPMRNLRNRGIRTIHSTGGSVLSFHPRGTSATPTTLTLEDRRGVQRVVTVSLTGIVRAR